MSKIISEYLDLMDSQRESVFNLLGHITDSQLWQRPAPKEWSIGEILNHNDLLFASYVPMMKLMWNWFGWYGKLKRKRTYKTEIDDLYSSPKFPQWVGFLWTPRFNQHKPISFEQIKTEIREMHKLIRAFYQDKDEDVLGNLYLYDPLFGWCNLIVTLRICIYHDQHHFNDVIKQAKEFIPGGHR